MGEAVIVGAGLAGLTAAYNLAKAGHQVTVLERFAKVGGLPEAHPAVDGTPMDPEKLGEFIGIELGEPMVTRGRSFNVYIYGREYRMVMEEGKTYLVERGNRESALDRHIFELCRQSGVHFEFNHPVRSQKDMAELPPNTIIATGMYVECFEALHIPYQMCYGHICTGRTEKQAHFASWFGPDIGDYAYIGCTNGVAFGLLFQREPVNREQKERWMRSLEEKEGIVFKHWIEHYGPAPIHRSFRPALFRADKIMAGQISGMMEPLFLFGVHGALVSGKIAAVAFEDKAAGFELFQYFNKYFRRGLILKRLFDPAPHALKKAFLRGIFEVRKRSPRLGQKVEDQMMKGIPGYGRLPVRRG